MNTALASGTWTIASPLVCAGPTSISSTSRPPTSTVEAAVERARRRRQRDAVEREVAEEAAEQLADVAGRRVEAGEHRRGDLAHLLGARRRGDDLGAGDELVAVAVVAVGVGVDDGVDGRRRGAPGERVEHLLGQLQVEQRVDEQRGPVADDQPGVAPAPRPVALDVRPAPVTRVVHRPIGPHGLDHATSARQRPIRRAARRSASIEGRDVRVGPRDVREDRGVDGVDVGEAVDEPVVVDDVAHPARRRGVVDAAGRVELVAVDEVGERPARRARSSRTARAPSRSSPASAIASSMAWPGAVGPRWFMAVTWMSPRRRMAPVTGPWTSTARDVGPQPQRHRQPEVVAQAVPERRVGAPGVAEQRRRPDRRRRRRPPRRPARRRRRRGGRRSPGSRRARSPPPSRRPRTVTPSEVDVGRRHPPAVPRRQLGDAWRRRPRRAAPRRSGRAPPPARSGPAPGPARRRRRSTPTTAYCARSPGVATIPLTAPDPPRPRPRTNGPVNSAPGAAIVSKKLGRTRRPARTGLDQRDVVAGLGEPAGDDAAGRAPADDDPAHGDRAAGQSPARWAASL